VSVGHINLFGLGHFGVINIEVMEDRND